MPSVYQTVFGGNPVAPAVPTYLALSFGVNTILGWPLESNITSPAVAEWIDCTATAPALTLQLSDARQVSTGYTAIFNNVGVNTFSVLDAQGNTLMAPASGAAWILVLSDNSTLQGTWRTLQLGAGVSSANAAALAGNGLKAITTTLNERIFINAQGSNYTIQSTDRAACVEWTGGAGGVFTSPNPATVGSDWFCYIKNSGTGILTFTPASGTVDGSANKTFNPNDSCIMVTDGTNFFSMGFGQSVASSFNFVTISLAGASGNVILNGAQLNRISYKFTGALAGNTTVVVPASIQQYWVDNETTGAFTLTISAGGAGSTFTVPQASRTILYCDGLNIVNAISSGAIQFADGTAAAPSITFASDTALGFYKAGADVLGISTAGVQRGVVNASGQWTINSPSSGTALTVSGIIAAGDGAAATPSITFASDLTAGLYKVGADILGFATAGAAVGQINATGVWTIPNQLAANVSGAAVPANGTYLPAANTLGFASAGSARGSINATGNWSVLAPSSGISFAINGLGTNDTLDLLNSSSGAGSSNFLNASNGTDADCKIILTQVTAASKFAQIGPATSIPLNIQTAGTLRAAFTTSNNNAMQINDAGGTLQNVGYKQLPQNLQVGNYTTVRADDGKHIFHNSGAAHTHTIDSNANVPYDLGATLTFVNVQGGGVLTIAINADTLVLLGSGATGSRTLAAAGMATAVKVTATQWMISGPGLS
jgi:hypothetical protein